MAKTHRTHEEATVEMFRKDPELAADYLNSVLEDGDETDLMLALRALSKAFGGVQEVARQADVNAHTLYRTLSEKGNPELRTLSAILKAMGMRLAIQPLSHQGQHHGHACYCSPPSPPNPSAGSRWVLAPTCIWASRTKKRS